MKPAAKRTTKSKSVGKPTVRQVDQTSPKATLMTNVLALMKQRELTVKSAVALSKQLGGHLTNGTLGRAMKGNTAMRIDNLAELAKVFELDPWKLLVPNLDPTNPPLLKSESDNLRAMLANVAKTKEAIEGYLRREGNTSPGELP